MKFDNKCNSGHVLGRRNADEEIPKMFSKGFVITVFCEWETEKFHHRVVVDLQ